MLPPVPYVFHKPFLLGVLISAALLAWTPPTQARVTRIIVDMKVSPAFGGASFGTAGQYETIAGRVFGELDPNDPHNTIINDIALAPKNAKGMVEYTATFFLVKPIDLSKSSHLMWQDVPNRGGRVTIPVASRNDGDIGLSSAGRATTRATPRTNLRRATPTITRSSPFPRIRTARRSRAPSWDAS